MAIGSVYVAALVLGGIIWLWVAAIRPPRIREPSCGRCGYPVQGLAGLTCPECGADFRLAGIATPTMRLMRPAVFIVLWTLLLPIPAAVLTESAREVGPKVQTGTCAFTLRPISGSAPAVRVTQRMHRSDWGRPAGQSGASITTTVTRTGGTLTTIMPNRLLDGVDGVEFLLEELSGATPTGRSHRVRLNGDGSAPVDVEALALWMLSLTGSTDRESVHDDAVELAGLLGSFAASGAPVTLARLALDGGVATTMSHHDAWWSLAALAAIWLAVYAGGIIVFIVVRQNRLQSAAQGAASRKS